VLATGYPQLQVLVVDNAPDDPRTAERIAAIFGTDPRVSYLAEPVPGASRARNRGVRASTGEIVAFVDDDIVVDRLWIAALTAAFADNPDVDCITGLVLPLAVDTPVHWWFEVYGGFDRGYRPRRFDLAAHRGDTLLYPYTAGALGGLGNAAFRREVLARDLPFDITLGPGTPAFGAEDQDVLLRVLREGRTILYEPAAIVQHRHRDSYADLRWQVFTYGAGFVAALTHWAAHDRAIARDLAKRIPPLLPAAFGRRSSEPAAVDAPEPEMLPKELRRLGQLGYLYGPIAYARAVAAQRRSDALQRSHAS
jgi:glycosyltransferase involved in cell wall biosynthesis